MEDLTYITEFVEKSTEHFDESHNVIHAMKVNDNAHKIMSELFSGYDKKFLTVIAMLHDVCDHKYGDASIPLSELVGFIRDVVYTEDSEKAELAINIIDNTSYSKQAAGKTIDYETSLSKEQLLCLNVLRDADRIEAIGAVGIERCRQFTIDRNPDIADDANAVTMIVLQHCHDKLLRLYNDGFISTSAGRNLAREHHEYIVDYVERNSVDR